MKTRTIQNKNRVSTKEYIIALSNYPNYLKLLNPEFKPYKTIYEWLMENQVRIADGDMNVPEVKKIAMKLNISRFKVHSGIQTIYDDILYLNDTQPELFCEQNQKLCFLSFNNIDHPVHFNLGLDVLPREGEVFYFQFVKPKNGGRVFYVYSIVHSYDKGDHKIRIFLTSEFPQKTMQLSNAKPRLIRDNSIIDLSEKPVPLLKEELVKNI